MPGSGGGLRFDFEWRTTLLTLLLLPFLVALGCWQLERAAEKVSLGASWAERQNSPAQSLSTLWDAPAEALAYLSVKLSGVFEPAQYFLLDNRIYGGRFGYEVLNVMKLDGDGRLVLVNRGWVAGDSSRRQLPSAPPPGGHVEIVGHIYIAPGKPYLLGEQQWEAGWPKVLQAVEIDKIQPLLGAAQLFPYSVRIEAGEPGALTVDWQIVNMSSEKHQAYAVQWFTMAAVLFIFFVLHSSNVWQFVKSARGKRVDGDD